MHASWIWNDVRLKNSLNNLSCTEEAKKLRVAAAEKKCKNESNCWKSSSSASGNFDTLAWNSKYKYDEPKEEK